MNKQKWVFIILYVLGDNGTYELKQKSSKQKKN